MRQNRSNLVLGLLLILVGGWLIVTNQVPAIQDWIKGHSTGAVYTVGAGLLILLIGLLTGAPGMAVPAAIVGGIGGILYYQDLQKDYSSWSYMWALIPGFVGVGTILAGLLGENTRRNLAHGLRLVVISAVLFLAFGALFGGLSFLGPYGAPILIILLGMYILARGFARSSRSGSGAPNETR
jgi:hypothetical protein